MTGQTERQYRRRAHDPARINFGVTAELRAALETLADKVRHLCGRGGARLHRGWHRRRTRPLTAVEAAQRTKGRRTVNRQPASTGLWPPSRVDARRQAERRFPDAGMPRKYNHTAGIRGQGRGGTLVPAGRRAGSPRGHVRPRAGRSQGRRRSLSASFSASSTESGADRRRRPPPVG